MVSSLHLCVLLGDVIESREIDDRRGLRTAIAAGIEVVNSEYSDALYAPMSMIRGIDEIGGALTTVNPLYAIIRAINDRIFPHRFRFVLVLDEIDVHRDPPKIAAMDGPAFHHADQLLTTIENESQYFAMETVDETTDTAITNQINLLELLRESWTEKQHEAYTAYSQHDTQTAAATTLGVTQQTLSQRLRAIHWRQVRLSEASLSDQLESYGQRVSQHVYY